MMNALRGRVMSGRCRAPPQDDARDVPGLCRSRLRITSSVWCPRNSFDLRKYPGSPRNPLTDDPLMGYKFDQGVAFLRAIRGETQDYPTFRDGAEAQRVIDAVEMAARERRWVDLRV